MIGHKSYPSSVSGPNTVMRHCHTTIPSLVSGSLQGKDLADAVQKEGITELSVFCEETLGERKKEFGDFIIFVEINDYEYEIKQFIEFVVNLQTAYGVHKEHLELFQSGKKLYVKIDSSSFLNSEGHSCLREIYQQMLESLKYPCPLCSRFELVTSVDAQNDIVPVFPHEWPTPYELKELLDPSVSDADLFIDHTTNRKISWLELYASGWKKPRQKTSLLRLLFLKSRQEIFKINPCTPNHHFLSHCAVLQDVASTTSWEETDELSLLWSACSINGIRSMRRLCYCLNVINQEIHKSDDLNMHKINNLKDVSCKSLSLHFNVRCHAGCPVSTPFVFPYANIKKYTPNSIFTVNGKYVLHAFDSSNKNPKEVVCSAFRATPVLDELGNLWGASIDIVGRQYCTLIKTVGESKKDVLKQLEKCNIALYKPSLAYCYLLSLLTDSEGLNAFAENGSHTAGWGTYIGLKCYIMPHRKNNSSLFLQSPRTKNYYSTAGTLESWRYFLDKIKPSPELAIVLGTAFAGPIIVFESKDSFVDMYGVQPSSFAIHLWGGASETKKGYTRIASSVWGSPRFTRSLDRVSEDLGAIAAMHNDSFISLTNTYGTSRTKTKNLLARLLSTPFSDQPHGAPFRHAVLSTGIEPCPTNINSTILNVEVGGAATSMIPTEEMDHKYGTAGLAYIAHLRTINRVNPDRLSLFRVDGLQQLLHSARTSHDKKILGIFSMLVKGLALASEAGIIPEYYLDMSILEAAYSQLRTKRTHNETSSIEAVKCYILEPYVHQIGDSDKCMREQHYDAFAFAKRPKGILFRIQSFESLFCGSVPRRRLAEMLLEDGLLLKDKKTASLTISRRVPSLGSSVRGYFIKT